MPCAAQKRVSNICGKSKKILPYPSIAFWFIVKVPPQFCDKILLNVEGVFTMLSVVYVKDE